MYDFSDELRFSLCEILLEMSFRETGKKKQEHWRTGASAAVTCHILANAMMVVGMCWAFFLKLQKQ